jgi:hypothetical protein
MGTLKAAWCVGKYCVSTKWAGDSGLKGYDALDREDSIKARGEMEGMEDARRGIIKWKRSRRMEMERKWKGNNGVDCVEMQENNGLKLGVTSDDSLVTVGFSVGSGCSFPSWTR